MSMDLVKELFPSWSILGAQEDGSGQIVSGRLITEFAEFPIINGVVRCVTDDGYAANFAHQWNTFRVTQYDSHTGLPLTFNRFWNNTKWKPRDLYGKTVLEAGCGAGRFTEILLEAGAQVINLEKDARIVLALKKL